MTGMRIGEATALNWSDIDFELGTVQISKNLIYKNRENYYLSDPKTSASNRTIALDQHTLSVLKQWQFLQSQATHTDFVLSYNQFPTTKGTIAKSISRHAKMANIHRITVHALRHSHASLLISMNVSPNLIKERLGHEDIKTTLVTYGHLYPNSDFKVAKQLDGILNIKFSLQNRLILNKNQFIGNGKYLYITFILHLSLSLFSNKYAMKSATPKEKSLKHPIYKGFRLSISHSHSVNSMDNIRRY